MRSRVIGDDGPTVLQVRRIQSVNTAAFPFNIMSADNKPPAETGGQADLLLQVGQDVGVVGPAAMNADNKSYTPVTIADKDGVWWVRTTSLGSVANYAKGGTLQVGMPVKMSTTPTLGGQPWWVWAAVGGGVLGLGVVGYLLFRNPRHAGRVTG